jgi:malonate-semialdehyde dehydrogenase (acetylating)/methylmalonate-semialdehyde dehydrogenase
MATTTTRELGHWIAGAAGSPGGQRLDVTNPATGEVVARLGVATIAEVDTAVRAATTAQVQWAHTSLARRTRVLFAFRELVAAHRDELAALISLEHGKVLADAAGEVARALDAVEFACGIPHLLRGGATSQASTGVDLRELRQPVGVVAGITPFNFPVMVPAWMHPLAIASGNAFVLKPSERVPSASLRIAELWDEAGLPPGVFTVLNGDRVVAEALVSHPDVAAVSFVGSTPVAREIHATARAAGKRVQALGGAKNHMVVLPDADLDQAADAAVSAGYGSAGQRCMAISVVVAVGPIADALVEKIAERAKTIRVGPFTDTTAELGPVISAAARDRIEQLVAQGAEQGATLALDGRRPDVAEHQDGFWVGPTLFDHVKPTHNVYREEVFGPVLSVVRVDRYDEALDLVRANPYGNGASIFTSDGGAARDFEIEVTAGAVGVNVPIPIPVSYHSFGGWKDSSFAEHGVYGDQGVAFYTRLKVVTTRWPDPSRGGVDLGFPATD